MEPRLQTLCRQYYSCAAVRRAVDLFCGGILSLRTATRYQLGVSKKGETIMNETLAAWAQRVLSVLRIYTGLLLLAHGTAKILGFPAVPSFANVQINSLTGTSGIIELIGGVLFTIGLLTR